MKLIAVAKEKFFDALCKSPADIMPSLTGSPRWSEASGYTSTWANQRTGEIVGKSFGAGLQTYQLTESFLMTVKE